MNNLEFVSKALDCATNHKTLYIKGCFGAPMNDKNKQRYCNNTDYNKRSERRAKIMAASADTFGFDCVCLVKGLLWGWRGDVNAQYGGAVYQSNGVPDIGTEAMLNECTGVSADFSNIEPGEYLWLKGHAGIYVGHGRAVECTPAWKDGVQITAVHNIGRIDGLNGREWTKHGKLPYITYEGIIAEANTDNEDEKAGTLKSDTSNSKSGTLNPGTPKSDTSNPKSGTLNPGTPKSDTLNPKSGTPKSDTSDSKSGTTKSDTNTGNSVDKLHGVLTTDAFISWLHKFLLAEGFDSKEADRLSADLREHISDGFSVSSDTFDGDGQALPFLVRITKDKTPVYSDACGLHAYVTVNKKEVFTIVDVRGVYGRLKSGAGWLDLRQVQFLQTVN